MNNASERPAIIIYSADDRLSEDIVKEILLGAEEEGVPAKTVMVEGETAEKLAQNAAIASALEVGIGVNGRNAVLQFRKLPELKPVGEIKETIKTEEYRNLGANAARLAKKMPLRGIDDRR